MFYLKVFHNFVIYCFRTGLSLIISTEVCYFFKHNKKLLFMKLFPICIFLLNFSFLIGQNSIDLNSLPDVETYTVVRTNPTADTVIIALHGGPTDMLYSGYFEFF